MNFTAVDNWQEKSTWNIPPYGSHCYQCYNHELADYLCRSCYSRVTSRCCLEVSRNGNCLRRCYRGDGRYSTWSAGWPTRKRLGVGIAVGLIGGILLICLIAAIFVCIRKWKNQRDRERQTVQTISEQVWMDKQV